MGNYISSSSKEYRWGWCRDIPDIRDFKISLKKNYIKSRVDLRAQMPPVYDQKELSSCTVNAVCGLIHFLENFEVSRLFVYYNLRNNDNKECNSLCSIRDCFKVINKYGICNESKWPYQVNYFTTQPNGDCYKYAVMKKSFKYKRVPKNIKSMKMCLSKGIPFVFGFSVYSSFLDPIIWNPKIDKMPIPNPNKDKLLGGHTVMAVGYSDKRKCFIIRNSIGPKWGLDGYFFIPYKFMVSDQCDDFWTIMDESFKPDREYTIVPKVENKNDKVLSVMVPKVEKENYNNKCLIKD